MKIRVGASLFILVAGATLLPAHASAEESAAAATQAQPAETRSVRQLRGDVRKAEKRFFDTYNKLVGTGQRINCADTASTGSRMTSRSCSTAAMESAGSNDAQGFMSAISANSSLTTQSAGTARAPAPQVVNGGDATASAQSEKDNYRRNAEKLLQDNPELRERLQEYNEAKRRLAAAEQAQGGK